MITAGQQIARQANANKNKDVFGNIIYNVKAYGAKGDGKKDDTASIQAAIDDAYDDGGGTVFVPFSKYGYLMGGSLIIKSNVRLQGFCNEVYKPDMYNPNKETYWRRGSCLLITGEPGITTSQAISMRDGTAIDGINFFYINQTDTNPPIPYSPTIRVQGNSVNIQNLFMINPYYAIDATAPHQELHIESIKGQPLRGGLFIDNSTTVDTFRDISFGPFWNWNNLVSNDSTRAIYYTQQNGVAFDIKRADDIELVSCFASYYLYGVNFSIGESNYGSYGRMLECGFDYCAVSLRSASGIGSNGWLISNSHIIPATDGGTDCYGVLIEDNVDGDLRFSNCGFWGNTTQMVSHAYLSDAGNITFDNCFFKVWKANEPAIDIYLNTNVIVASSRFDPLPSGGFHFAFASDFVGRFLICTGTNFLGSAFTVYKGIALPGMKLSSCVDLNGGLDTLVSTGRHTWKTNVSDAGVVTYSEI